MAKTLSKSTPIKITIGLLIVVGLAIAAMSAGWVDHNSDIKAIGVKTDTIKVEGCNPAKELAISVAVIDTKLKNIKEDVAESRVEQRADTKAILEAINENK